MQSSHVMLWLNEELSNKSTRIFSNTVNIAFVASSFQSLAAGIKDFRPGTEVDLNKTWRQYSNFLRNKAYITHTLTLDMRPNLAYTLTHVVDIYQ